MQESQSEENSETLDGLDYFPERRGGKISRTFLQTVLTGGNREQLKKVKCEKNVQKVISQNPLLQFLTFALKNSGCEIDLSRHICCEPCSEAVTGGYDCELNQIVVCQNTATSENAVMGALAHEMIHMFDYCRADLDLKNLDHLICTEIRAANLIHCSFMGAMVSGTASPIRIKKQHQECVKNRAILSALAVRNISRTEAEESLNRVFSRCYNDLEPLGRRLKRGATDMEKIYRERYHYKYS